MKRQGTLVLLIALVLAMLGPVGCGGEGSDFDDSGTAEPAHAPLEDAQPQAAEPEPVEPGAERVDSDTLTVSFSRDVEPIFVSACVDCHHPDNAVKVDLTRPFHPELGIINRKNTWTQSEKEFLVVPGDPEASALILKVSRTDLEPKVDGDPMPWNIPILSNQELETLRSWISSGANDDTLFRGQVRLIFGDGVSLGRRGGKCAYCHHPSAPYGPDLTRVFDPETGAVDVAADRGGIRIVPGETEQSVLLVRVSADLMPPELAPLMPKHFSRLTSEEIAVLEQWIAMGALND